MRVTDEYAALITARNTSDSVKSELSKDVSDAIKKLKPTRNNTLVLKKLRHHRVLLFAVMPCLLYRITSRFKTICYPRSMLFKSVIMTQRCSGQTDDRGADIFHIVKLLSSKPVRSFCASVCRYGVSKLFEPVPCVWQIVILFSMKSLPDGAVCSQIMISVSRLSRERER